MAQHYIWPKLKERSVLPLGLTLAGVVLSLPWIIYHMVGWVQKNPLPPSNAELLYQKALETGWETAVAVQTAEDRQEWKQIAQQWQDAIALLDQVQQMSTQQTHDIASKIAEYQGYQEYAAQRADASPPEFDWEAVPQLAGGLSYVLVDSSNTDPLSLGPELKIDITQTITNGAYVDAVLASLDLPPIGLAQIAVGENVQLKNDQYVISDYPLGQISLHRTLCSDSFAVNSKYECLWKITLQ
ncbi:MAG TPA: hypothetical protein V6D07_18375 [Trichocoleus sp.]